jgi:ankyrin repeat protein
VSKELDIVTDIKDPMDKLVKVFEKDKSLEKRRELINQKDIKEAIQILYEQASARIEEDKQVENSFILTDQARNEAKDYNLSESTYLRFLQPLSNTQIKSFIKGENSTDTHWLVLLLNIVSNKYRELFPPIDQLLKNRLVKQIALAWNSCGNELTLGEQIYLNVGSDKCITEPETKSKEIATDGVGSEVTNVEEIYVKERTTLVHELFTAKVEPKKIIKYFERLNGLANENPALVQNYLQLKDENGRTIVALLEEKSAENGQYRDIINTIKTKCPRIFPVGNKNTTINVDTHTESVHKSVDESLVRLFTAYAQQKYIKAIDSRKVEINRTDEWKKQINTLITNLSKKLDTLHNNEKNILELLEIKDEAGKNKNQNEINRFKFQLSAAKRMIDDVKSKDRYGTYTIAVNEPVSCGLTVKEIIAIGYDALNKHDQNKWKNPEAQKGHFIGFIENLYKSRRGYNIDRGEDEILSSNDKKVQPDDNKCLGGTVNQIVYGLTDHNDVEIKVITESTMHPVLLGRLKKYNFIIEDVDTKNDIALWRITNNIPEKLVKKIVDQLLQDKEFLEEFGEVPINKFVPSILNKLSRQELESIFGQQIKLDNADHLLMLNNFVYNENHGYIPYVENLYLEKSPDFEAVVFKIIQDINGEDSTEEKASRALLDLLLSSPNEEFTAVIKDSIIKKLNLLQRVEKDNLGILASDNRELKLLECLINHDKHLWKAEDSRAGHRDFRIMNYLIKEGIPLRLFKNLVDQAKAGGLDIINEIEYDAPILSIAAEYGHKEIVKFLLTIDGIDINAKNNYHKTALIIAAENGQKEIIELLLTKQGIDINTKDRYLSTALMYAAEKGHKEIAELLLTKQGIDVNAKNTSYFTALMEAARHGREEIVELLLKKPDIDINAQDQYGLTAFAEAARRGYKGIVELLTKEPDIQIVQDNYGNTALMYAAEYGYKEIVELLLTKQGIDINAKDKDSYTALTKAAEGGHKEIVELLLMQPGIDINAQDNGGYTALIKAAQGGHKEIVELLLMQPGIDINAQDKYGKTAFARAWQSKHRNQDIIDYFSNYRDSINYLIRGIEAKDIDQICKAIRYGANVNYKKWPWGDSLLTKIGKMLAKGNNAENVAKVKSALPTQTIGDNNITKLDEIIAKNKPGKGIMDRLVSYKDSIKAFFNSHTSRNKPNLPIPGLMEYLTKDTTVAEDEDQKESRKPKRKQRKHNIQKHKPRRR